MQYPAAKKSDGLILSLIILTFFFVFVELSLFFQANHAYFTHYSLFSEQFGAPRLLKLALLNYIFIQIALHSLLMIIPYWTTKQFARQFKWSSDKTLYIGLSMWFIFIFAILLLNQYYFPQSIFADLTRSIFFNSVMLNSSLAILSFISVFILCSALSLFIFYSNKKYLIVGLILFTFLFLSAHKKITFQTSTNSLPNIFIIGIDSLKPTALGYFGGDQRIPFIDEFLNQSVVFTENLTPLARTFPSWVSILTGKYPSKTGIRTNLAETASMNFSETLPAILKHKGYETVFATDEIRFSNIDKQFGFDHIITPPIGLNNFILGTINDFPLSNLLINTPLGRLLFPESYANRAVFHSYKPNTFLKRIDHYLSKQHESPLFLSVHFCLIHFPYLYADSKHDDSSMRERYASSVLRIDNQIKHLFALLKEKHLLDNAIVVLLSDHGEALELEGDRLTEADLYQAPTKIPRFYPPTLEEEKVNQSAGHGTDVLGLAQYHTLLAFKRYGDTQFANADVSGLSSLLDIKPTLLSLLNIDLPPSLDGISLTPYLQGKETRILGDRVLFWESDFSPEAIRTSYPNVSKAVLEGIALFYVNPKTNRLYVKPAMLNMIMKTKQYAVIYKNWILATYPHLGGDEQMILINTDSGAWTNELSSTFALNSPIDQLLTHLKQFK